MMDDIDDFYARHAEGGPSNVVVVHAQRKAGGEHHAIFSTLEKARAWSDSLSDDEYIGSVIAPYIIDVPEYGNVPERERQ